MDRKGDHADDDHHHDRLGDPSDEKREHAYGLLYDASHFVTPVPSARACIAESYFMTRSPR